MKADTRQTYRIGVTQPLQFAKRHKTTPTGEALLLDLSDSGCAIHSMGKLQIGDRLALVLNIPQPMLITDARVVWTNGTLYGLAFVRVSPLERTRLRRFLWQQISRTTADDWQPLAALADRASVSRGGLRMVP